MTSSSDLRHPRTGHRPSARGAAVIFAAFNALMVALLVVFGLTLPADSFNLALSLLVLPWFLGVIVLGLLWSTARSGAGSRPVASDRTLVGRGFGWYEARRVKTLSRARLGDERVVGAEGLAYLYEPLGYQPVETFWLQTPQGRNLVTRYRKTRQPTSEEVDALLRRVRGGT